MTEEIKKLIDDIPIQFKSVNGDWVLKSDFDRVVEDLTKWNKVEDKLPKEGETVLVRGYSRKIYICKYNKSEFIDDSDYLPLVNIIEWKYIN